jgi:peptidoglycan/LPS O-acetylase OafA/YrhL
MISLERSKENNWGRYSLRRLFRIAPLFYVSVLLWSLFYLFAGKNIDIEKILLSVLFLNGFIPRHIHSSVPHGWSIAVETSFYFILPIIFLKIKNLKQSLWLLIVATPVCVCVSWCLPLIVMTLSSERIDIRQYTVYWLPAQIPIFLVGISAYFAVYGKCLLSEKVRSWCYSHRYYLAFFIMSCALISGYLPARISNMTAAYGWGAWIILLSYIQKSALANPIVIKIGLISFSAYLFHQAGIDIALKIFTSFGKEMDILHKFFGIITASLLSYTFALLGYYLIEQPSIRLGKRFTS